MTETQRIKAWGIKPPVFQQPFVIGIGDVDQLISHAQRLIDSGEYGLGVTRAITAFEVCVLVRLRELKGAIGHSQEEIADSLLNKDNLNIDKRVDEYENLAKKNIKTENDWTELIKAREKRNKFVHLDTGVSRDDANQALKAVQSIIKKIRS